MLISLRNNILLRYEVLHEVFLTNEIFVLCYVGDELQQSCANYDVFTSEGIMTVDSCSSFPMVTRCMSSQCVCREPYYVDDAASIKCVPGKPIKKHILLSLIKSLI